jgi:hypothetical protein
MITAAVFYALLFYAFASYVHWARGEFRRLQGAVEALRRDIEKSDMIVVVATDALTAMTFAKRTDVPIDLGPPKDPLRYQPGARRWGWKR